MSCHRTDAKPPPAHASGPSRGGELVASIRSEPATYNRFVAAGARAATDVVTLLTQARLVRVNRATDELEPWLAEGWTTSADGLAYTMTLRPGVQFSDGEPLTSADVLFSFRAAYDPARRAARSRPTSRSTASRSTCPRPDRADGRRSVFPEPFAPGLRLLDSLPIVPRHKLEAALDGGQFQDAWVPSKPLTDIAGLGPFHPRRARRRTAAGLRAQSALLPPRPAGVQLPYLDRLTLAVVPDQNTEALQSRGRRDRSDEQRRHPAAGLRGIQAARRPGRLRMIEVGVGLDPDFLSFNLRPGAKPSPGARRGCRARSSGRQSRAASIVRRSSTRSTSARRRRSSGRSRPATGAGIRRASAGVRRRDRRQGSRAPDCSPPRA